MWTGERNKSEEFEFLNFNWLETSELMSWTNYFTFLSSQNRILAITNLEKLPTEVSNKTKANIWLTTLANVLVC